MNDGGLHTQTWVHRSPSSSLAYLRTWAFTLITKCAVRRGGFIEGKDTRGSIIQHLTRKLLHATHSWHGAAGIGLHAVYILVSNNKTKKMTWQCSNVIGAHYITSALDRRWEQKEKSHFSLEAALKIHRRKTIQTNHWPTLTSRGQPLFWATAPMSDTWWAKSGVNGPLMWGFNCWRTRQKEGVLDNRFATADYIVFWLCRHERARLSKITRQS